MLDWKLQSSRKMGKREQTNFFLHFFFLKPLSLEMQYINSTALNSNTPTYLTLSVCLSNYLFLHTLTYLQICPKNVMYQLPTHLPQSLPPSVSHSIPIFSTYFPPFCLLAWLPIYLHTYLSVCLFTHTSASTPTYLKLGEPVYLPDWLPTTYLP